MPLTDSRLGPGTLSLATVDYSFQVANAVLTPDVSEEDGTPTLATPEPSPLATIKWALEGTVIQDFTAGPEAFVHYCMDNALDEVAFSFVPATAAAGLAYSGTVQIRPVAIGGDAAVQITTDFSFPIVGPIVRTDPTAGGLAASSSSSSKGRAA
jgi:hypothetical protein